MRGRTLDWLVGKWQWPYAALFAAGFLALATPLVIRFAGWPIGLVFLQLPIYMLHQYEEHAGDRSAVLEEIERSWERQARRPTAEEIDAWIEVGRQDPRSE